MRPIKHIGVALLLAGLGLCRPARAAGAGLCRALIVAGDPGSQRNAAARFDDWTRRWAALLEKVYGFKSENVRVLRSGVRGATSRPAKPDKIPPADLATRKNVLAALAGLVRESKSDDQVVLVLIGHGYDSQGLSKLCLPGRDLSDVEAGRALAALRAKQLICINTAPASLPWAKALAGEGRAIITATGKPGMRSQTYFCEFLLRALKGGKVTLLDAFQRASRNTIRWYQNQFVDGEATEVHGKEFQEIWKAMHPDRKMVPGDAKPREPDNDPENQEAWLGRRVIPELAGLEDNGDGTPTTILGDKAEIVALPTASGDGQRSRTILLGKP